MPVRLAALTMLAASLAAPALAQGDPYAMAHAAAANQLGIMEYCQGRGDVGADAVAAQRGAMARLPASATSNEADEALGKQGTLAAPNGARMTVESMASTHGTTVSALCKQMGSSALQSAAAYQGGTMPGGMAMPKMPAMPNGMAMPTVPSAPQPQ